MQQASLKGDSTRHGAEEQTYLTSYQDLWGHIFCKSLYTFRKLEKIVGLSLSRCKVIVTIGTINWRSQFFLFVVLGPKSYVVFDFLTSYVHCTTLLIFKKIFFCSQRWQESPDFDRADRNGTINWLTLWSCQGYGHCAANINVRNT